MNKTTVSAGLLFLLLQGLATRPVEARERGLTIGITGQYITFGRDFDGDHLFSAGDEILLVPKIDGGLGFGVTVHRRTHGGDFGVRLAYSSHDYRFEDLDGEASCTSAGTSMRFYIPSRGSLRPYGSFGGGICWLRVENASLTVHEPIRYGAARYTGVEILGGLGLAVARGQSLILHIGADLRLGLFGRGKGVLNESYRLDRLTSLSFVPGCGISFDL